MGDDDRGNGPADVQGSPALDPVATAPTIAFPTSEGGAPAAARPEPAASASPRTTSPGQVPEPAGREWTTEPSDPFEGIDRSSPFEGRPPSQTPSAEEPLEEEPPPPGQPLRRPGEGGDHT